jgi:hypothetical protein
MPKFPAPNEPPTMRVNLGTCAHDPAVTIFAPFFAMPPASASRPTMKPAGKKSHQTELIIIMVFFSLSRKCQDSASIQGYEYFLPYCFKFI